MYYITSAEKSLMRKNANMLQTVEAVQPKALEQLLTVADVARILA